MTAPNPADDLFFNPLDPGFRINPYPVYRRLQEEDPRHRSPWGSLVLSRYADCVALLRDDRVSTDERNSSLYQSFATAQGSRAALLETFEQMRPFLFLDPPDHTRLRGLVSKAFTPKVVEGLRPRIQQLVDECIDAAKGSGQLEVIEDLAYPVPVRVISELLGVPPEDHDTFKGWSKEMARALDPDFVLPDDVIARREAAALAFAEYFRALIAERRRQPRDDLLSALVHAEDEGQTLNEGELLATCILLLVAGHETTVNLIGNGVLALLRDRPQFERLVADPSLARSAVEEVLRYDPPVQMTARVAMDDIEVGDEVLHAGDQVILLLAAANRDPDVFADPDRFDVGRADNRHIAFSFGIHFCLGAPLARVEAQMTLGALARRLPQMELATDDPAYKENIVLRGLAALPVAF